MRPERSHASNSGTQRDGLVERHPQGIDIGPRVAGAGLAADLLGSHVPQRSHQVSRARRPRRVARDPRQAEIGHPEPPLGVDDQIRGLDVAVDRRPANERAPAPRPLADPSGRRSRARDSGPSAMPAIGRRERRCFAIPPQRPQDLGQRSALDQRHRIERDSVLEASGEHGDDIRVIQARRRLRLDAESLERARVDASRIRA